MTVYTNAQLEDGIARAIAAHDFPAVVTLLRQLAIQDPDRAAEVRTIIDVGLALGRRSC